MYKNVLYQKDDGFSKWDLVVVVSFFIVLLIGTGVIIWGEHGGKQSEKVAASIFPIYDLTKNIAGDGIEVELVMPVGASPHTYNPAPEDVKKLIGSAVVFTVGHGLDNWMQDITAAAEVKTVVELDKNITLLSGIKQADLEGSSGFNPHYWLSVSNAKLITAQIKDQLIEIFPEKRDQITKNYQFYTESLSSLDQELKTAFSALPNKNIATFHNAWIYFADAYDFSIQMTFEEFPGREPSPQYLADFQSTIKQSGIEVIYAEPQFSTAALEPIANDYRITISYLDPLGGVAGRESYIDLMRYNEAQILNTLGGE